MLLYTLRDDAVVPAGLPQAGVADPFAHVHWENPLNHPPRPAAAPRLILFSGWFEADDDDGDATAAPAPATDPRRGIFPSSHQTWGPRAWAALEDLCDSLLPDLRAAGATACFRPHHRHILADPQSCLAFLRKHESQPFEIVLEPAAFLTLDMLPRAEDHLTRAFEALAGHPKVAALLLSNLGDAGGQAACSPLTTGRIDPQLLITLARRNASHLPWILLDSDLDTQIALINAAI